MLNRSQVVKIGNTVSKPLVLSTGTPQGCPMSPKLYSIFTYDCKVEFPGSLIIKFADDTTVSGLISDNNGSDYRNQVNGVVQWCDENDLRLNVSKTKEMIIDFRLKKAPLAPLSIKGTNVDTVDSFRFLGAVINKTLTWDNQCRSLLSKARQRLYFVRKLKSFKVKKSILVSFYRSIVESILTSSITVWYDRATLLDLKKMQSVVRQAELLIGTNLPSLNELYITRVSAKTTKMRKDPFHPANRYFELLPSNRRLRQFMGNKRFVNSFFPEAVKLFNNTRVNRV